MSDVLTPLDELGARRNSGAVVGGLDVGAVSRTGCPVDGFVRRMMTGDELDGANVGTVLLGVVVLIGAVVR